MKRTTSTCVGRTLEIISSSIFESLSLSLSRLIRNPIEETRRSYPVRSLIRVPVLLSQSDFNVVSNPIPFLPVLRA